MEEEKANHADTAHFDLYCGFGCHWKTFVEYRQKLEREADCGKGEQGKVQSPETASSQQTGLSILQL